MTPPHERYYAHNVARWTCPLDFTITDQAAFRAAPMGLLDRARALFMALAPRVVGRFRMETTVVRDGDGFVHTTRVSLWGLPLLVGTEWLALDPDGVSVHLRCVHRQGPFWTAQRFSGEARVADDGLSVAYTFHPWFGGTLDQTGEIDGQETVLTQRTPWFAGVQRLRRVG